MKPTNRNQSPGVFVPPPLIYIAGFALSLGLNQLWPIELFTEPLAAPGPLAAKIIGTLGLISIIAGMFNFATHCTAISPASGATRLITTGPYRISRNPIYVGFSLIYLAALVRTRIMALPCLVVVLLVMTRCVIPREEQHLTAVFGNSYRDYCRRVLCWL